MRRLTIRHFAEFYVSWYPIVLFLIFQGCAVGMAVSRKAAFWSRAMVALVVATFLAHVNRIFHFWPAHLVFPSGHMTFCLGLSVSLAMLRPWTLVATLPLVLVLATFLVALHYHSKFDITGAFPLVLVVYGLIHRFWRLPSDAPLLDRGAVST